MKEQSIYQRITRVESLIKANDRKVQTSWEKYEKVKFRKSPGSRAHKAEAEHLAEINFYLRQLVSKLRKEYVDSLAETKETLAKNK